LRFVCHCGIRPRVSRKYTKLKQHVEGENLDQGPQYEFIKSFIPLPGSCRARVTIFLAFFELIADIVNLGTSVDVWLVLLIAKQPLKGEGWIFFLLAMTIVLYVSIQVIVLWKMYVISDEEKNV